MVSDSAAPASVSSSGISSWEAAARCSVVKVSCWPRRRIYKFESPQPCSSLEPRSAWPGREPFESLRAWWTKTTATPKRRCSSRKNERSTAICEASFSSTRCSRIIGSKMSRTGRSDSTVLVSRARSISVSSRSAGAVMTSTGKASNAAPAAAQMPCKRRRTTANESSAGKRRTRPDWRTGCRRRQGKPEATLTARSKARKLLQHLGSPPKMPTACSDHRPSTSQRVVPATSAGSSLARWNGSKLTRAPVSGRAWDRARRPRSKVFHPGAPAPGGWPPPADRSPCS